MDVAGTDNALREKARQAIKQSDSSPGEKAFWLKSLDYSYTPSVTGVAIPSTVSYTVGNTSPGTSYNAADIVRSTGRL